MCFYHYFYFVFFLLVNVPFIADSQNAIDSSVYNIERFNKERKLMVQRNAEQATDYFRNGAEYFKNKGDSVHHLFCIVHLSDIEHRKGQFNSAFDLLFDALPMASLLSNKRPLLEFHQMLGILYAVYRKDNIALNHTKAGLEIAKKYAKQDSLYRGRLTSCYLDVAIQYVAMDDYSSALRYLDSCYISDNSGKRLFFVDGVFGQVYLALGDYENAQKYLDGVIPFLIQRGNGFQTSVYYFLGNLNSAQNKSGSAIFYYQKSLTAIDSLQNNLKLKPIVLEELAKEYFKVNKSQKAFLLMQEAKLLSDSLFNTQSKQNKALFEIKNRYKEDLAKQEEQLAVQSEMLNLSQKAKLRLKLLIAIFVLLTGIAFFAFRLRVKMKRISFEKKLNDEKNETIVGVKNKELTANALQIIEKEQAVKELLDTILEKSPEVYKSLRRKYKQSNKKIWEDFHLRFTQTNDIFYKRLLELHPDLTPTDLKHCALIKLNFDCKEMSHLLGISINSVHMARSRIRTKLKLKREDSLGNYLASI